MFKNLGGLGDMAKMMKAAQEMQGRVSEVQESLGRISVEGTAGGGLVRATATAKGEITALSIDPSLLVPEDREVVEDLVLAAVRDALRKGQERMTEEMARVTDGLGLPPLGF
jgi:DNA-binding YbaB/EbfC family protein